MRAYWELAKAGFRRYSRYRTAMVSSVFVNTVFGLLRASFLLAAIHQAGGTYNGYDAVKIATYVWLGQALLGPVDVWGSSVNIGARIKSGDVAVDFTRPISILGSSLATNYGRAAFELLPRAVPPMIIGAFVTGIALPTNPAAWALGLFAVIIAIAMNHTFYFTVGLSALWIVENRGWSVFAQVMQNLLSGFLVPVALFPAWLGAIAHATPFPAMFQTPVDILAQRVDPVEGLPLIAIQLGWLAVIVVVCLGALHLGRRKVVIQGG